MGTTFSVTVIAPRLDSARLLALRQAVQDVLRDIDVAMSTYRTDSELSRFNQHRSSEPYRLSSDLFEVFSLAHQVSVASGGAFDVTVGPLVDAWGFGPAGEPPALPSDLDVERLRERVGFRKLILDPRSSTIAKSIPDLQCDLSAIAPGYAVDKIAESLEQRRIDRYLIEVGGELRTRGLNADSQPWRIAIERPQPAPGSIQRIVALSGLALATSGDYRNTYERDGKRYSHTLDPHTGRPIENRLASASVIAPTCALADAWATALMALGPERALAAAEERQLPVLLLIYAGTAGEVEERMSSAFAQSYDSGISRPAP
jgi:thiamine biosynthesis lipoprotein